MFPNIERNGTNFSEISESRVFFVSNPKRMVDMKKYKKLWRYSKIHLQNHCGR